MAQRLSLTSVVFALVLLASPAAARPDQRLALVIGNSSYPEAPLKNPVNDARAVADELRKQVFEVILRENAKRRDMEIAIADFGEKLGEGATGLFFYAGHGMQVQGRNYLVPIDARLSAEARVRFEAVDVDGVLDQMQAARAKVSMVILDACRNNPYERRFRSGGAGLAQLNAPEGTLIAYATAPGKVASDGDGTNGLYTREFLHAVRMPGLKVEEVFKQVRANVSRASGGAQVPWEASSLTGDFYFVPPKPVAPPPIAAPAAAPVLAPAPNPQALDLAFWESVKGSSNPAELQAYLDQFPQGTFVPLARARVAALSRPAPAPATPPPALQQAATPPPAAPVDNPAIEQALWDSVKGSTNPMELQAYLDRFPNGTFAPIARTRIAAAARSATPHAGSFDGRYTARFPGPLGTVSATLDIRGTVISGFANPGEASNFWASNNFCRLAGAVDAAGVIGTLDFNCSNYAWVFSGRLVPDEAAGYVIESTGRSITAGDRQVIWKKGGS